MATYYIGAQAFGINSFAHANSANRQFYNGQRVKYINKYYKNGNWHYVYDEPKKGAIPSGRVKYAPTTKTGVYARSTQSISRDKSYAGSTRPQNMNGSSPKIWVENNAKPDTPIQKVVKTASAAISNGRSFIENLFNKAAGFARDAAGKVASLAKTAWSTVRRVGGEAIKRGREFLEKAFGAVREFVTGEDARRRMTQGKDVLERIQGKRDYDRTLPGMAENVGRSVSRAAQDAGRAVSGAAESASKAAKEAIDRAGEWLNGPAKAAAESVVNNIINAGGSVMGIFNGANGPVVVAQQNGETRVIPVGGVRYEPYTGYARKSEASTTRDPGNTASGNAGPVTRRR